MVEPPAVTVIIVAYNSGSYLQACVNALAAQTFYDFEAIIADNASQDDSVRLLRLPDPRFGVIDMQANLGFAAANNRIAERSKSEFLVLLNPDTVVDPNWLGALVGAARQHPDAASIGSVQVRLDDPDRLDGLGDVWHAAGLAWRGGEGRLRSGMKGADGEIFGPCAAAALYRRTDFLALGGFDERFFCYCEDVDLALRLRLAGRRSYRAAEAVVWHAGSGITGRQSEFSLFHGHRNRIWTFLKNTPQGWYALLLPYHLIFNLFYLLRAWRRGVLGAVARAYWAAWRGRRPFLAERRRLRPATPYSQLMRVMAVSPWSALFKSVAPKP